MLYLVDLSNLAGLMMVGVFQKSEEVRLLMCFSNLKVL